MNFPPRAEEIVRTMYARDIPLARGNNDERRLLTRKIAEQLRFELGLNWGTKSTGPGAPQSKDALAYRDFFSNPPGMDIWDWQNGSTRAPQVKAGDPPSYSNVIGQLFIEVNPTNHLSTSPEPNEPNGPVTDETPSPDLSNLEALIRTQFEIHHTRVNILEQQVTNLINNPPIYKGKLFGFTITLRPED